MPTPAAYSPETIRQAVALAAVRVKYRHLTAQPSAVWQPIPGPQTAGYESAADELFYGGSAGGGKTDLLLGLAGTKHRSSLILRRIFPSLRAIIERSREIYNSTNAAHSKDSYNESLHLWRLADGRLVELGSVQQEKDKEKYRGRPHDFIGWDEITEFTESQYRFVNAWLRTTHTGQRTRIVATGNPPTSAQGRWVIKYWGPWLDPTHPHPAQPGELRWYAVVDGQDVERPDGVPFAHNGETIYPRSRTFIPARLSDNPYLDSDPFYRAVLQNLPEPLRSQMLNGDFNAGVEDQPWQVIPTYLVLAAQKRWLESPEAWRKAGKPLLVDDRFMPLTALGVDVAYGGKDDTVLARRYAEWFAPLERHPGTATPDGRTTAQYATMALTEGGYCNIDGIGWGADAYQRLKDNVGARANAIIFSHGATDTAGRPLTDKSGKLKLANVRAVAYWRFREALSEPDCTIALPPDPELQADLCAPRYEVRNGAIYIEAKEDLSQRLGGRSPDAGDAVVLAWYEPPKRLSLRVLA